ncbi:hypothetical protein [Williamsia maris]|nr:hypothetical protein [Williamsia maris]
MRSPGLASEERLITMLTHRAIFRDSCAVVLTRSETDSAVRQARRAAREAQETLTLTARRQYRRYRARAGDVFMEWPGWHEAYLEAYRWKPLDIGTKNQWGGMPPGSYGGTW